MSIEPIPGIAAAIIEAVSRWRERPALTVDGETFTYAELFTSASELAARLHTPSAVEQQPVTAIVAQRRCSSYVGVLAALLGGHTYVPVNVEHPLSHNVRILGRSGAGRLVCGDLASDYVDSLLASSPQLKETLQVIHCGDRKEAFRTNGDLRAPGTVPGVGAQANAYILFTSGSTGEPKGVPISHENLAGYLEGVRAVLDISPDDRLSQTFELTFDVSVHDMLVCWTNGAHLIVPQLGDLAIPAEYIRRNRITCWFSVPSLAYQCRLQGHLRKNAFPDLRWSLFAGEGLPAALAQEWAAAAPASRVENWYGPTEATIVCARFPLPLDGTGLEGPNDLVPIGTAFPAMELTVCGDDLQPVAPGTPGELFLGGRQVAKGYLADPERTARSFIALPGRAGTFYRTGDLVVRRADGVIHFLGRVDNQVKIRGYRVELGAIEAAARAAVGAHNVIALPWPPGSASGRSVVLAIEAATANLPVIMDVMQQKLPDYMVPSRIVCLPIFPTTVSGKVDRKAVAAKVEEAFQRDRRGADLADLSPAAVQLIEAVLSLTPNLSPADILQAETLMASGMDSLSFVGLTAEIERLFAISLTPADVISFAEMSFHELVDEVVGRSKATVDTASAAVATSLQASGQAGPSLKSDASSMPISRLRGNRALQFIERFPAALRTDGPPFVPAIGSSGIFQGFVPQIFDAIARQAGSPVRSLNIGLPHIACSGLSRICEFVRDRCREAGVRVPLAVFELDPMHISVLPPVGEIEIEPEHFSGRIWSFVDDSEHQELGWSIERSGMWAFELAQPQRAAQPRWQGRRHLDVARTYLGDVDFVSEVMATWIEGARALASITDRLIGFVHPVNPARVHPASGRRSDNRLSAALREIEAGAEIEFIPWHEFDLAPSDFRNINHVNVRTGMSKLTEQLARKCFA